MIETTAELLSLYSAEKGEKLKIGKCGKPCRSSCPKRNPDCEAV